MRTASEKYRLIQRTVYLFLGGAIDAVVIRNFIAWCQSIATFDATLLSQLLTYSFIVFLIPIGLAWLFSRTFPEKTISPPLYMQLIAVGLLVFFVYNELNLPSFSICYILAIYAYSGGKFQDGIIVYALGKTVLRDDILKYSFKASSDIAKVQEIIMARPIRDRLDLRQIPKKQDESLKLKTPRSSKIQIILELKEGAQSGETLINIAVYEELKYSY